MQKTLSEVDEQIKQWENRIFYPDLKFRKNTPADLDLLEKMIRDSNLKNKTLILSSETEGVVYKTARFIVEMGVKNDQITFLDGDSILPYIDTSARYKWQSRKLIDEYIQSLSKDIANKWVIIPEMNAEWDRSLALYFISEFKKQQPYGIIFYSNVNYHDNLAQILIEETHEQIFQFPKSKYTPKKEKQIEDDGY